MDIREVVQNARAVTECSGVIVSRAELVGQSGYNVDPNEEGVLSDFAGRFSGEFQAVSVLPTILDLVKDKINKPVIIREMEVSDSDIYGYVEDYKDQAIVKIKPGMNPCWKRFTVVKELMHLYSDTCSESCSASASITINAARRSRDIVAKDNTILGNEEAAFYMALEVLIPWKLRDQLLQLRELGATHYQIAKVFMLPQTLVTHFLEDDDNKPYIDLSRRINNNIP